MKKLIFILLFLLLSGCTKRDTPLRVMSFNIRYNNPVDGENTWENRKELAASMIIFHKAELIGMQEALKDQIEDFETLLPGYG